MNRRDFLKTTAMATPALRLGTHPLAAQSFNTSEGAKWRTYEVKTSVHVLRPQGETRVWLPQPLAQDTPFQRTLSSSVQCSDGKTFLHEDRGTGLKMLAATFPAGASPTIATVHRIATRDWIVDLDDKNQVYQQALNSGGRLDLLEADGVCPYGWNRQSESRRDYPLALTRTSRRRARSMSGSSRTPIAKQPYEDAASVTSGRCWRWGILGGKCARSQCALCGTGKGFGRSCAGCLWASRGAIGLTVFQPGHLVRHILEGAALPCGGIPFGFRVGADGSSRRP